MTTKLLKLLILVVGLSCFSANGQSRFFRYVTNVADLVKVNPAGNDRLYRLLGYYTEADGGGGSYQWLPGSTLNTNIGPPTFASTYPGASGRFQLIDFITDIRQFGAVAGPTNWTTTVQRAINAATTNDFSFLIPANFIWDSHALIVTNSGSIDTFAGWDQAPSAGPDPVSGERVRYLWGNRGGGAVNEQRWQADFHPGLILNVDKMNPSQDSIFSGQNRTNPAKASIIWQDEGLDRFLLQYVNHTNATDYAGMVIQPFWTTITMTGVTSASFASPPAYREYIKGATSGAYGYVVSISSSNIVVHWRGDNTFQVGENLIDNNETSSTTVTAVSPSSLFANTQGNLILFDDNQYGQVAFGSIKALLAPWNFHGLVSLQGTRDFGQTVMTNYPYGGLLLTASEEAVTPYIGKIIFRDDLEVLHLNDFDVQLGDTNTFLDPQGLKRSVLIYGNGGGAGYSMADTNALWSVLTSNGLLNFGDSNTTDVVFTQQGTGLFASGLTVGSLTNVAASGAINWNNDGVVTTAFFDGTSQVLAFTNAAIALQMGAPTNLLALDASGVITNVASLVNLSYDPATRTLTASAAGGSGTVTNFSVGAMSPIFTVSDPTTFPLLAPVDPGATRLWGWDDTDGVAQQITVGSGLAYDAPSNTLSATAGGGGTVTDVLSGNITNLWTVGIATSTTTPTFTFTRVDPGADRIVIFDNTDDQYVQAVIGSGLSYDAGTDTLTATGGSGDITSVGDVASGAAFDGTQGTILTFNNAGGDGTFSYDGTSFPLSHPLDLGAAGVRLSGDGDGALTLLGLGNGADEALTLNLDDTANEVVLSSSTGATNINLSANTLSLSVPNFAYDSTAWNGLQTVPTRDDIRDLVQTLAVVNTNGLEGWQAVGSGADFTWGASATWEKIQFGTSGPGFTLTNAGRYQVILNLGVDNDGTDHMDFYVTNVTDSVYITGSRHAVYSSSSPDDPGVVLTYSFQVATTGSSKAFEVWGQTLDPTYADDTVLATNTVLNVLYLGNPSGGGSSTAWNDIGDATADGTIALAGFETDFTSTIDAAGESIWTITNTDADAANDNSFLDLRHNDGADANVFYTRFIGDNDGAPSNDYLFSQTAMTLGTGIQQVITGNSAASTPISTLTGTWFTGGSSTTTKPHFLIEPSGATSTGWDTGGTGLGINAASGTTANLLDLQINGSSKVRVNEFGTLTSAITSAASTREVIWNTSVSDAGNDKGGLVNATSLDGSYISTSWGYADSLNTISSFQLRGMISAANDASSSATQGIVDVLATRTSSASDPNNGSLTDIVNRKLFTVRSVTGNALEVQANYRSDFFGGIGFGALSGSADLFINREAAAITQFGADSSSPVAQTIKGPDATGSNISGGNTTFGAGRSTGTGVPGTVLIAVGTTGASGSGVNAYATSVGAGGTLKVDTTTTGNVGAGEDDLISYTIPAAQLSKDGSYIEFDVFGTFAATANSAQVKIYFDGAAFFDSTSQVFNGLTWRATGKIIRTGAATQKIICEFGVSGTLLGALTTTTRAYATDTATLSGATIFKVTGQDTGGVPADNKVVQEGMVLKWYPGQ